MPSFRVPEDVAKMKESYVVDLSSDSINRIADKVVEKLLSTFKEDTHTGEAEMVDVIFKPNVLFSELDEGDLFIFSDCYYMKVVKPILDVPVTYESLAVDLRTGICEDFGDKTPVRKIKGRFLVE